MKNKSIVDSYIEQLSKMSRIERDSLFERILARVKEKEKTWWLDEENIGKILFLWAEQFGEITDFKTSLGEKIPEFNDFGKIYHVPGWYIGKIIYKYVLIREDKDFDIQYYLQEKIDITKNTETNLLGKAYKEFCEGLSKIGVKYGITMYKGQYLVMNFLDFYDGNFEDYVGKKGLVYKIFGKIIPKKFIIEKQKKKITKLVQKIGIKYFKIVNELFGLSKPLEFVDEKICIKKITKKYDGDF